MDNEMNINYEESKKAYTEVKLTELEKLMREIAYQGMKRDMAITELKEEMKEFKNEMKDFKEEMKDFKEEMKDFKNEMKDFKEEMKEFKNEMKDFKEEMKDFKNESQKRWGDLANKMGTLVEDIFYPSTDIALEKKFDCKLDMIDMNRRYRKKGENEEYDILGYSGNRIFLIEVKSNPDKIDNINNFFEKVKKAPIFLGEDNEIVPIYAGINMRETTVAQIKKRGGYCMKLRGNILEIE